MVVVVVVVVVVVIVISPSISYPFQCCDKVPESTIGGEAQALWQWVCGAAFLIWQERA